MTCDSCAKSDEEYCLPCRERRFNKGFKYQKNKIIKNRYKILAFVFCMWWFWFFGSFTLKLAAALPEVDKEIFIIGSVFSIAPLAFFLGLLDVPKKNNKKEVGET